MAERLVRLRNPELKARILAEESDPNSPLGFYVHYPQLKWEGHEFLETIRDGAIWTETKKGAKAVGNGTLRFVGELALGIAKQKAVDLGLPLV